MKYLPALAVFLLSFMWGCSESTPKPPIPQIPSAEGLHFSVSFFEEAVAQNQIVTSTLAGEQHNDHFNQASVRADNLGTYPEAVLGRAYQALTQVGSPAPAFKNGGYEWAFSWSYKSGPFQGAVLRADLEGDQALWSLRDEMGRVWLEGVTALDSATVGRWTVSNTAIPESPRALMVDWGLGLEARSLEMAFIQEGHSKFGSHMELNVSIYTHTLRFEDNTVENGFTHIGWNAETNEGLLQAHDYHDAVEACWGNDLQDSFCSPEF